MASDKNNTNKETFGVLAGCGGVSLDIARGEKKGKDGELGGFERGGGSNVRVVLQAVPCHRNVDQSCRRQRVYLLAGTTAADGKREAGGLVRRDVGGLTASVLTCDLCSSRSSCFC